jgi:hypothetical protein
VGLRLPAIQFDQMHQRKMRNAIAEACETGRICVLDLTNVKLLIGIGESLPRGHEETSHRLFPMH